jgi:hypothetical protein
MASAILSSRDRLQFPEMLDPEGEVVVMLKAYVKQMKGKSTLNPQLVNLSKKTLVLPTPTNGFSDTHNNSWDNEEGMVSLDELKKAGTAMLVKKIKEAVGGGLAKRYEKTQKWLTNDYAGIFYSGNEFREFTFDWSLVPRNQREAIVIEEMLSYFKYFSLPQYAGWKIHYPHFWEIAVLFPGDQEKFVIKDCVNTSFDAKYFSDGGAPLFRDGRPQKVDLTLTFKELYRHSRSDVFSADNQGGG